jgi:hypothetical protein
MSGQRPNGPDRVNGPERADAPDRPIAPDLEQRFDAELRRAARALVIEDLPRGVLDQGLSPDGLGGVRARRPFPAYAGFAAAVILLLATAIALVPGGLSPASPSPSTGPTTPSAQPATPSPTPTGPAVVGNFRSTSEIRADLERLGYLCKVGSPLLPTGPSPSAVALEGAICEAPEGDGTYMAAVIVGEAKDGRVVEVDVKADAVGEDTPAARDAIAQALAKAAAISVQGQATANELAGWVLDVVPPLAQLNGNSTDIGGFAIKLVRGQSGGYQLWLHQL